MPRLNVTNRAGVTAAVEAAAGRSVMETIVDAGYAELLAICGGGCSCGTCHVIVDPAWFGRLGPVHDDEEDMLEVAAHRTPTSRLSCQVQMTAALNGLAVTIAPED